jgi:DnaJ-class molecular chaperone
VTAETPVIAKTPWAELFVHPADADDTRVRTAYHALAVHQHPDRVGANGMTGPRWHAVTEAYSLIKTATLRDAWLRRAAILASLCPPCGGTGVMQGGTWRKPLVLLCPACLGAGRTRTTQEMPAKRGTKK